jgi:phage N-6-adenine-methyltransferase
MKNIRDEWRTPEYLFEILDNEFNFTVDACAKQENRLCERYWKDCLKESWEGEKVFMNPPYSNPRPFIQKAYDESLNCLVVALIKCDPSTKLWGIIYDYEKQQLKNGVRVRFFPKRVKFIPPKNISESSPNFSSCVIIMERGKDANCERDHSN